MKMKSATDEELANCQNAGTACGAGEGEGDTHTSPANRLDCSRVGK